MMKILLAQQNYHIGNFEANREKIITAINEAKNQKADLIVFSELAVCGYLGRDFFEFRDFIDKCYESIEIIKEHADNIGVLIGTPTRNPNSLGKDLFNSARRTDDGFFEPHFYEIIFDPFYKRFINEINIESRFKKFRA